MDAAYATNRPKPVPVAKGTTLQIAALLRQTIQLFCRLKLISTMHCLLSMVRYENLSLKAVVLISFF
jgi:hypothetical protein